MKIETRSIQFDNLLVYETTQLRTDWQEGIFLLEDLLLAEGIYQNGPIFFSCSPLNGEDKFGRFTYYLPINHPVRLENEPDFRYEENFYVEKALTLRQADQDLDIYAAYEKLQNATKEKEIALEDTFYCVLLKVFDDIIIDLYVPIRNEHHDF